MLHFFGFISRPPVQTISNAFCRSIHTMSVFLCWNLSPIVCDMFHPRCNDVLGNRPALRQATFQDSKNHCNVVLIILSSTLTMQLVRLFGL